MINLEMNVLTVHTLFTQIDNEILLFGFVTMDEEVESKTYSQPDNALIVCVKPHYPLENIPETDSMLRGCLLCCQDFDT